MSEVDCTSEEASAAVSNRPRLCENSSAQRSQGSLTPSLSRDRALRLNLRGRFSHLHFFRHRISRFHTASARSCHWRRAALRIFTYLVCSRFHGMYCWHQTPDLGVGVRLVAAAPSGADVAQSVQQAALLLGLSNVRRDGVHQRRR